MDAVFHLRDTLAICSSNLQKKGPGELAQTEEDSWEIVLLSSLYVGGNVLRACRPEIVIKCAVSRFQHEMTIWAVLQVLLDLAFDRRRKFPL